MNAAFWIGLGLLFVGLTIGIRLLLDHFFPIGPKDRP